MIGRTYLTLKVLAFGWAALLLLRNPGWIADCRESPDALLLVVPLVFGPLIAVYWLGWVVRGRDADPPSHP